MSENRQRSSNPPSGEALPADVQSLLAEIQREPMPERLLTLAERLQEALRQKDETGRGV